MAYPRRFTIVGDSFARGAGASSRSLGYASQLATALGAAVKVVAVSGGGFVNPGPRHGPVHLGPLGRQRVLIRRDHSPMLVQASGNDRMYPRRDIERAMHRFLDGVGPRSLAISTPVWAGRFAHLLPVVSQAARTVADERGALFIDASDWIAGLDDPFTALAADGAHPNDAGHRLLASRFAEAVRPLFWA